MLLSLGASYDWDLFYSGGSDKYLYTKNKNYIKSAQLTIDETFDLAGYYSFFNDNNFAYQITKGLIEKTENADNLVFFLKLIHLTNLKLSRKTYLDLFLRIQIHSGNQFCKLFNSPKLNFQILDDLEIKKIYCKQCNDIIN